VGLLEILRHCPRCGAPGGGGPPFRCAACGLLLFTNPATAVGVFVLDGEGRVLLLRRAKDPGRGLLGLPGGFVDAGEGVEAALAREVREEIGGALLDPRFLCSHPNRYEFAGVPYDVCDLFFTARLAPGELRPDPEEVGGHIWLRPGEVQPGQLAFASHRHALAALRKALA
jgi:ADP-ribose pyrophosphatase YjhB (NUDIX family)